MTLSCWGQLGCASLTMILSVRNGISFAASASLARVSHRGRCESMKALAGLRLQMRLYCHRSDVLVVAKYTHNVNLILFNKTKVILNCLCSPSLFIGFHKTNNWRHDMEIHRLQRLRILTSVQLLVLRLIIIRRECMCSSHSQINILALNNHACYSNVSWESVGLIFCALFMALEAALSIVFVVVFQAPGPGVAL